MKSLRAILLMLMQAVGFLAAQAYDFAYNNMYFNLDRSTYSATLTYNTTSYNSYRGEIEVPEVIVGPKDILYTVTAIGDNALRGSTGVNKITIPGTVTSIGSGACYGCTGITLLEVPSSVLSIGNDAFYGCSKLATARLSEGLQSIGSRAFMNTVLKSIVLPESVTSIGQSCFEHGTSSTPAMEKAYLGNAITVIPGSCFRGQRNLSDARWGSLVESIGSEAFYNCSSLTDAKLGSVMKSVGSSAFYGCSALQKITIPASMESIGTDAFYRTGISTLVYAPGCTTTLRTYATATTKVSFPSSLESVAPKAFYDFSQLAEAVMPDGITTIGSSAFEGCSTLMLAKLPSQLTSISDRTFYGCTTLKTIDFPAPLETIGASAFYNCGSLSSLTVTRNLKRIGTDAFLNSGIRELTYEEGVTSTLRTYANKTEKLSLPSTLKAVTYRCFYGFSRLAEVRFPDSVDSIASEAFYDCSVMEVTHTPRRIRYVGTEAFRNCSAFKELSVPSTLTYIGTDAFYNSGIMKLTYEEGVTTALRTYANKTVELSLPSSLLSISNDCFKQFSLLTKVSIPDHVESIGSSAFYACPVMVLTHMSVNIKSIGSEAFRDCSATKELTIPSTLTSVGTNAFYNSGVAKLTYKSGCTSTIPTYANHTVALILPSTVTEISPSAFQDFRELTGVTFPKNLEAIGSGSFKGCTQLATVTIPSTVTSIGTDAFAGSALTYLIYAPGCKTLLRTYSTSLVSVVVPKSAVSMPADAFQGCSKLEDVYVSDLEMWNFLFHDKTANPLPSDHRLYMKDRLLTVLNADFGMAVMPYAFAGCKELRRVNLTGSVTSVREHAFEGCKDLEAVAMGDRVFSLGASAFEGCTHLGSVRLGKGLDAIGKDAFSGCSLLSSIHFGGNERTIGEGAFRDCITLQDIFLPASLATIKASAFSGCSYLRGISIPDGVKAIEASTFLGCKRLRNVELGAAVTSLGSHAFDNCDALQSIHTPDTLATISSYCFSECDSLRYVFLGSGTASIGDYAFASCPRLLGFYCYASAVPACSSSAFSGSDPQYIDLFVPSQSLSAYSGRSPWSSFGLKGEAESKGKVVQSIKLPVSVVLLKGGDTYALTPSLNPADATNPKINWQSKNTAVAYVSNTGLVLANDPGTTTITATAADNDCARATCTVIVDNNYTAVSSLTLSQTALSLREGGEAYLSVALTPSVPTYAGVEWSSSDTSVAIVSPFGRVIALKEGSATISCRAADGKGASASCAVTVSKAVSPEIGDVDNDGVVDNVDVNLITRIVMEQVEATGDTSLYDLNQDGEITIGDITGIIDILLGGGEAPGDISVFALSPKEITIDSLATYQLECIVLPRAMTNTLTWRSSNPDVATVDSHGLVTGLKPGEAMVYVTAAGGMADSCRVTVGCEQYLKLYEDWTSTNKGQRSSTSSHTYTVEAKKGDKLSFDWTVSSESGSDYLIVTLGGMEVLNESGEKSGTYTYTFRSDHTYTIVVKYTKDSSRNNGSDQATIRNFKVEGGNTPVVPPYTGETTTVTVKGVTFKMIKVEAGTFTMGATAEQQSPDSDEKPAHKVTISKDYYIGETEVTQALWKAVMGNTPTSSGSQWSSSYGIGDNYPAYYISWDDVQEFIKKLNDLTGMEFRLPTEAEWEYAARGGNKSQGYQYSGSNMIWDVAWYDGNSGGEVHPVGTKLANEIGIYDMSGNVWEWCQDWFSSSYYSSSPSTDPAGPTSGSNRVSRGGGWGGNAGKCRSAYRSRDYPLSRSGILGARLALSSSHSGGNPSVGTEPKVSYSHAVDLGLPSGTKWADMNVGADKPEDYGWYLAWGETEEKSTYNWSSYKWCNGSAGKMTKYSRSTSYWDSSLGTSPDQKTVLDPEDDAAHVNWGGNWRMPTDAELTELRSKCTWTWTYQNGVYGKKVTGPNGNTIFLPASGYSYDSSSSSVGSRGYYWSSSLIASSSGSAYCLYFSSGNVDWNGSYRYGGRSVRAVCP